MKKLLLFSICSCFAISMFGQSKTYYFIKSSKNIELTVADSLHNVNWELLNSANQFETIISASGNTYAAPTTTAKYRVIYQAPCGDIYSDTMSLVVYDTITDIASYNTVSASYFYTSGVSAAEMKVLNYSVSDLLLGGYSLQDLILGGYFLEDFRSAGVTDTELTAAGIIGSITDTDGKTYKWVQIGEQIWMSENMAYSCTSNCRGDECIPTDISYSSETGQYYYSTAADPFGGGILYIADCGIKVCPSGWHVPSQTEWNELFRTAGYDFSQGDIPLGTDYCFNNNCTSFSGQSTPLFIGGSTGLNLDYNHGLMYTSVKKQNEVVAYQTSTFVNGYLDTTVVYFTKQNSATNYAPQSWIPLVRCVKD